MMFLRRVYSITLKEYKHILRDPFTLTVALILPLAFVAFFGFVIDLDYKNIGVAVRDYDNTAASRKFMKEISSSGYFNLSFLESGADLERALNRNNSPAVLIIKKDFGKNIARGDLSRPAQAQLLLDGSDNAKTAIAQNYMNAVVLKSNTRFLKENKELSHLAAANPAALVRTRFMFNPELNSRWFIVPALNTVIIGFLSILLTALTVAKEWENGSMELLLSTPVKSAEIVLGKLIPYFTLTFVDIMIVFVLSLFVFRIPFLGSFLLYLIACGIFIAGCLALGLLISVVTRNQQAAIQFAFAAGLLPSFIFSGFIFPLENMPLFFRIFTMVFPQRWFMHLSRTMFLSEAGLSALWPSFLGITVFAAVMVFAAVKKFKTDIEP